MTDDERTTEQRLDDLERGFIQIMHGEAMLPEPELLVEPLRALWQVVALLLGLVLMLALAVLALAAGVIRQ